MLLLARDADPEAKDSQGKLPVSIGKKSPKPFVKMLFKKGAEIAKYEMMFQNQKASRKRET